MILAEVLAKLSFLNVRLGLVGLSRRSGKKTRRRFGAPAGQQAYEVFCTKLSDKDEASNKLLKKFNETAQADGALE
jgi:hypothetical protein